MLNGVCSIIDAPTKEEKSYVVLVDSSVSRYKEVFYHELSHLFQNIFDIHKRKDFYNPENFNSYKKSIINIIIKNFGLPRHVFDYVFSTDEFYPQLDDLCKGLKKLHKTYYEELNLNAFYNVILNFLKNYNIENNKSTLFQQFKECNGNNFVPLIMLIGAYATNTKYQLIKNRIMTYLKD